jgi:tryptophan 2,3-dioxygenase
MGFLEFRDQLYPASGFQSTQFRVLENELGLQRERRVPYGGRPYETYLKKDDADAVVAAEDEVSVFQLVERWLERTPFLAMGSYDFWVSYRSAVDDMIAEDQRTIEANEHVSADVKASFTEELEGTRSHWNTLFDADAHAALVKRGDRRLSHKATQAALLITLYQHEPLLQAPAKILSLLQDIDELLVAWRQRHALMVHRMLGVKMGTGGSSGYRYLSTTAARHKVFSDFANLSTFIIPRHRLPPLPADVRRQLAFAGEPAHEADA